MINLTATDIHTGADMRLSLVLMRIFAFNDSQSQSIQHHDLQKPFAPELSEFVLRIYKESYSGMAVLTPHFLYLVIMLANVHI
jgi:hypothetical protein